MREMYAPPQMYGLLVMRPRSANWLMATTFGVTTHGSASTNASRNQESTCCGCTPKRRAKFPSTISRSM